jgi:alpha-L-fucosidase
MIPFTNLKILKVDREMAQIGVIFHWGLYSVPGFATKNKRTKEGNGAEWYLKRLTEKGNFRPISGWKETQKYHKETFGDSSYEDFADAFLCENWDPKEWMKLCKKAGAEYVILTTKHHDGFCLWPTKTTKYNSFKRGPKRDLVLEFKEAAEEVGLIFGVYYSWGEFGKGITKEYLKEIVEPQIRELIKYEPAVWWFDMHWELKTKIANQKVGELVDLIKRKLPGVCINDRIYGPGSEEKVSYEADINYLGKATYRVYGDRGMPSETPEVDWEFIGTIGSSWGINHQTPVEDYKSGKQLLALYQRVTELNGRFLINLGPDSDGSLLEAEVNSLLDFGRRAKKYRAELDE